MYSTVIWTYTPSFLPPFSLIRALASKVGNFIYTSQRAEKSILLHIMGFTYTASYMWISLTSLKSILSNESSKANQSFFPFCHAYILKKTSFSFLQRHISWITNNSLANYSNYSALYLNLYATVQLLVTLEMSCSFPGTYKSSSRTML